MRATRGRTADIDSTDDLERHLGSQVRSMNGWHVRGLDLRDHGDKLGPLDPAGSLFLGCRFADGVEQDLRERGALIFPDVPDAPVDTYRSSLYSPDELYDGLASSYEETLDARVYAWSQQEPTVDATLAQALHDHAVDHSLRDWVRGRRLVGVMGGHGGSRGSRGYAEAARLGRLLARDDLVVATGGGPGAMEAANLGAYLSPYDEPALTEALDSLAAVSGFAPSVTSWVRAAFAVRERRPDGAASLGIPTWHYGHEPPNAFASGVAKYFRNAIREDVLLHLCDAGIVFLPGAAGTVQEVFQEACENYYSDPSGTAPMVLVGIEYWTQTLPAWPLLRALAQDRDMQGQVHLVDTVDDVLPRLRSRPGT
jgi:predicted Rossmann-fold nucleotide-binding protein